MRILNLFFSCRGILALPLLVALTASAVHAQTPVSAVQQPTPAISFPEERAPMLVARDTELYCAGFIEYTPSRNTLEVVGGEQEQEQRIYADGDYVFINAGAEQGIRVGQEFSVVRPRGQFKTKLSKKKGLLGVYTQEIGRLRVTEVKARSSVAFVVRSCELIQLGDLLRAMPQGVAPRGREAGVLDRFADPSGKQTGRIVLSRDGREMLSRSQIVFIDLGAEDGVKKGDYLTIYRPAGTGNITRYRDEEISPAANAGFESDTFRGGKFAINGRSVKNPSRTGVYGPTITSPQVKGRRPVVPRKLVGEVVILNVQARTATAIITRVAQEVHTGDFVELQ